MDQLDSVHSCSIFKMLRPSLLQISPPPLVVCLPMVHISPVLENWLSFPWVMTVRKGRDTQTEQSTFVPCLVQWDKAMGIDCSMWWTEGKVASQGGHFAGSVLCWLFLEKTYSRWGKAVPPIPAENQFQSAQTPPTTVLVKRGSTGEHVFSACRANKFDGEGPPQKRCYHLSSLACPGKVFLLHPRILTGPRHALDRVRRLDHLNPAPLSSQEHSLAVHEALRLRQCLDFFFVYFLKASQWAQYYYLSLSLSALFLAWHQV